MKFTFVRRCGAALMLAGSSTGLVACGSIRTQMNEVVVTAVPADVAKCKALGMVATHSSELEDKNGGLDQLRAQAVQKGANTVLVTSYALSTTGRVFACTPPLSPDSHSVRQPAETPPS